MNKEVATLREERKAIEKSMGKILAQPEFQKLTHLAFSDDGSSLKINRPGKNKGWSLSKSDLERLVRDYFFSTTSPSAAGCYEYIVNSNKQTTDEFAFEHAAAKK
jgi:hypothetical protein